MQAITRYFVGGKRISLILFADVHLLPESDVNLGIKSVLPYTITGQQSNKESYS
jgi:hypothetical protein